MSQLDEEKQAYLVQMQAERGYVLDFHKVLASEDFDFLKSYNAFLQAAYLNPNTSLDKKTKELVLIGILVAIRSLPSHIKTHMEVARQLGATKKEVLEVLEMSLPPAGVAAFMEGFALWREVFEVQTDA
jgi:4-carboxymuconolactone decarboxylase